jgi:hypothetical protein
MVLQSHHSKNFVSKLRAEVMSTSPKILLAIGGALAAPDAPSFFAFPAFLAKNHGGK